MDVDVHVDVHVVIDTDVVAVVCLDGSYGLIGPVSVETTRSRRTRGFSRLDCSNTAIASKTSRMAAHSSAATSDRVEARGIPTELSAPFRDVERWRPRRPSSRWNPNIAASSAGLTFRCVQAHDSDYVSVYDHVHVHVYEVIETVQHFEGIH